VQKARTSPQGQDEHQDFSHASERDEQLLVALREREPTAVKHLHVVAHAVHDDATTDEYADVHAEINPEGSAAERDIVLREEIDKISMFEEIARLAAAPDILSQGPGARRNLLC